MKSKDILVKKVSIEKLEAPKRIHKTPMIGQYAVVQGNKIWKSNIITLDDAKLVVKIYDSTLPDHPPLDIVLITK